MTDSSLTHLRGFGDSISKLVAKTVSTIRDIIHPSTITVEVSKGTDHRQLVPLLWDRLQNVSVDPDLFLNYEGEPKPGEDVDEATQFYLQKLFKEAGVERYNAEVLASLLACVGWLESRDGSPEEQELFEQMYPGVNDKSDAGPNGKRRFTCSLKLKSDTGSTSRPATSFTFDLDQFPKYSQSTRETDRLNEKLRGLGPEMLTSADAVRRALSLRSLKDKEAMAGKLRPGRV